MNYRTGKILLITSLLLLPAAFSPARGEEPAFSYTHIHRGGSVSTMDALVNVFWTQNLKN